MRAWLTSAAREERMRLRDEERDGCWRRTGESRVRADVADKTVRIDEITLRGMFPRVSRNAQVVPGESRKPAGRQPGGKTKLTRLCSAGSVPCAVP